MVRGEPNSGKTTFLRKICYDWAQVHHASNNTNHSGRPKELLCSDLKVSLEPYDLMLPVILRLVRHGASFEDVVQDQMDFLSPKQMLALKWFLSKHPERAIVVFDGLDEYNDSTSKDISDIMKGIKYNQICCVITSRPAAVERTAKWTWITYREAELKGFDEDHIKEYIDKFFFKSKQKGITLCEIIFVEQTGSSNDLLELAKNPGLLCMLCILHEQCRPIGTNKEELYEEFTAFILSRWEKKYKEHEERTARSIILKEHRGLLEKFGRLAYTFTEANDMELSFPMHQVKTIIGDNAMDYGFLYNSHPVSRISDCQVSFVHKTVQEYLAALYISRKELDSFKSKCKEIKFLKNEVSLTRFLVHRFLKPAQVYHFVKYLTEFNPTQSLLTYLLRDLFPGYHCKKEFEDLILTSRNYTFLYIFPHCVLCLPVDNNHDDRLPEYRKWILLSRSEKLTEINLSKPHIDMDDVTSLTICGNGAFSESDDNLDITCSTDCEVEVDVDACFLAKLNLRDIRKLKKVSLCHDEDETEMDVEELAVEMERVNIHGSISCVASWILKIESLTMDHCSLEKRDISDLVSGLQLSNATEKATETLDCKLQELDLRGNKKLGGSGIEIKKLLSLIPSCKEISLYDCGLNDADFKSVIEAVLEKPRKDENQERLQVPNQSKIYTKPDCVGIIQRTS